MVLQDNVRPEVESSQPDLIRAADVAGAVPTSCWQQPHAVALHCSACPVVICMKSTLQRSHYASKLKYPWCKVWPE